MLSEVLALRSDLPTRTAIPIKTIEHFLRYSVPSDIIQDVEKCCFSEWVPIGSVDLVPMVALVEQTHGVMECAEHGYVVIAGCRNFDPIAVNVRTRRMVFVSVELLWSSDRKHFEDCLRPTPLSYEQFWQEAASEPSFPRDSYEAEDRWPMVDKVG